MILLLVNEWFCTQSFEHEFFAAIDRSDYEFVIVELVKKVVARVIPKKDDHGGGEGNQLSFFTGEPYTKYEKDKSSKYSANLDAAMITVAFLAPAVKQSNEQLSNLDHQLEAELPGWVHNLRDAALSVIMDGLNYAKDRIKTHKPDFVPPSCNGCRAPDLLRKSPARRESRLSRDRSRGYRLGRLRQFLSNEPITLE